MNEQSHDPIYLNKGSLSASQYKEGAAKVLRNIPLTVFALALGILCLTSSIYQILTDDGFSVVNILTLALSIMLLAFTPSLPYIQANGLHKQLCRSINIKENENIPTKVMFYSDHLVYISDESASIIDYKNIKRHYTTANTLSIRTRDNVLIVLPKSGFLGGSCEDIVNLF